MLPILFFILCGPAVVVVVTGTVISLRKPRGNNDD